MRVGDYVMTRTYKTGTVIGISNKGTVYVRLSSGDTIISNEKNLSNMFSKKEV